MVTQLRENCFVIGRAALDLSLRALGVLNPLPLFNGKKSSRQSIVFQSFSTHLAQCYEPIISRLRSQYPEINLQFMILLHPHVPLSEIRKLRRYAREELKIPDSNLFYYWSRVWSAFDLLVCGDIFAHFPLRRTRTVLLPHGTGLMPRMFEPHPLRKSMLDFDRIILAGSYDVDAVREHPTASHILPRVVAAGFPFLDRLKKPRLSRDQYFDRLGLDRKKPVVLFAPHWTALRASGAIPYVKSVVSALLPLDANFVLKLHACSFYPAMAQHVAWRPIVDELARDRRVHVDEDMDDLLALSYADVLVTDFSSRAFVFIALEKPVVLHAPDGADPVEESGDRMALMKSASYVARSSSEVAELATRLLRDPAVPQASGSVSERCFANLGQATQPVTDLLKQELAK